MNKRNRLKTIRPQNERAARAFRKKQNMKVELNKKVAACCLCGDARYLYFTECDK